LQKQTASLNISKFKRTHQSMVNAKQHLIQKKEMGERNY
jgi:hypothetical protein